MINKTEPSTPPFQFQNKKNYNQKRNNNKINNNNQLLDKDFIFFINSLNESIKEYYKVSRNNINDSNSFFNLYKKNGEEIESLIDEIQNYKSYQRINELFEKIQKINEIMTQLHTNTDSNMQNLNLFLKDAKLLFKQMKLKGKEIFGEIKNYNNNNIQINKSNKNVLSDSYSNSFNVIQSNNLSNNNLNNNTPNQINKIKYNIIHDSRLNQLSIDNIYSTLIQLLKGFGEFNAVIKQMNIEASNKYINLQNIIKKELDKLMKVAKNKILEQNRNNYLKNKDLEIDDGQNRDNNNRRKSLPIKISKEFERLKQINFINEKKIKELNNELNSYRNKKNYTTGFNNDIDMNKIQELQIKNNSLKIKLLEAEKEITDRDKRIMNLKNNLPNNLNNSTNYNDLNINDLLKQKDFQITNLQKQLLIYQKNENLLNSHINDLNNNFKTKIKQCESQIAFMKNKNVSLTKIIDNNNRDISKYKNEKNENIKEIENLKMKINNQMISNMNNVNNGNHSNIGYQKIIQRLQNDVNNYKNLINQYEKQIIELKENKNKNNNINLNNDMALQQKKEIRNTEIQQKENEFNRSNLSENRSNITNVQNNKIIEEQKMKINQLNKEINNYKRKEKINLDNNIKKIEEMNNTILQINQIVEQKDEIIRQLKERNMNSQKNNDNIDMLKMKLSNMEFENEKLQKEIKDLKNLDNNNILDNNNNKKIGSNIAKIDDNIKINENTLKIKELTLENEKYKKSLLSTKEDITKLESDINKKNEELEGLKIVIFKLQSQLEKTDDKIRLNKKQENSNNNINQNEQNKSSEMIKDGNTTMINNLKKQLNDAEKKISILQKNNKELQFKLEEKEVEKELSGFRTEDVNYSNYEEEFDIKKMANGAREKNRSEDINIDYPGIQDIKEKYKDLLQTMNMLQEQVKILICNITSYMGIDPSPYLNKNIIHPK